MRIGVITTSFPRYTQDIAGNFVLASCRALVERGHTIEVLAPEPAEATTPLTSDNLRVSYVPYLRPRSWQRTFYGDGVPDNLVNDPRAWLGLAPFSVALASAVASHAVHWDAVITHWALPCALAASLRPKRCRHLSILHSADVHLLARLPGRRALASAILNGAEHLWFSSDSLRQKFSTLLDARARDQLVDKSTCHPMPVAAPLATESRDVLRARLNLRGFVALALGRLVPVKGLEHAIEAVRGTNVQLVIAGDGPERARLEQAAQPLGAQVRFVGTVVGQQKSDWMAAVDAFVVPSIVLASGRTEGVPTAAIEAMTHSCPVVSSNVGGVGDLITDQDNGVLVSPGNPAALRAALLTLEREPHLRDALAVAARESTQRLRWDHVAQAWEALLRTRSPMSFVATTD